MAELQLSRRGLKLERLLRDRIVFLDGAMGTLIQREGLCEADFHKGDSRLQNSGAALLGDNDLLNISRPDIIEKIHRQYYLAGSDIVTTNTFALTRIAQADYGIADDLIDRLNREAVKLARNAAQSAAKTLGKDPEDLFVAGSIGPMNKAASIACDVEDPSKRAVDFDELESAYYAQMRSLYEAGVDLFLLETSIDTLNVKAAVHACLRLSDEVGVRLPISISVTISDASGRILSGQTIEAFYASIRHANPLFVGLNCSLGAEKMRPYLEAFDRIAECFLHCYPNAGMPNPLSEFGYDQKPEDTARYLGAYARDGLLNVIGGCCGTTPAHIQAIVKECLHCAPRKPRARKHSMMLSGLELFELKEGKAPFVFVGERTNVMGSPAFRKMIKEGRFADALSVARSQIENGANLIDVNFDEGMLDSSACMAKFLNLVGADPEIARVPIMIDSSDWETILSGLKRIQGKGVVNSISLKEGKKKFIEHARELKKFGAAVIVMAFDEEGQASTLERRVSICKRAYDILVNEVDFPPEDIIFDANVLTVATGMREHDSYGIDFIKAVEAIKSQCPLARTSAGVSNISFSLRGNNAVREAMHTVFLYHARKAGLDMGIVNAGMLGSYDQIEPKLRGAVEAVILNSSPSATENLLAMAEEFKGQSHEHKNAETAWNDLSWEEKLYTAFIKGLDDKAEEIALHYYRESGSAISVIENQLMSAMKKVGELFGDGKMFLPQVVKSARVMKKAVAVLEPFMESTSDKKGAKIVIATVKGDVHDIGKNIVSVVLACNGYNVVDLGVMVEPERIFEAAKQADLVGLSGLITPSLEEMANVIKLFERNGLRIPVLVGGAATSKVHTAVKLAPLYSGIVERVGDASLISGVCAGLLGSDKKVYSLEILAAQQRLRDDFNASNSGAKQGEILPIEEAKKHAYKTIYREPRTPEFVGVKTFEVPLEKLEKLMPWHMLFKTWGLDSRAARNTPEFEEFFRDANEAFDLLKGIARPKIRGGIFKARSEDADIIIYSESGEELERLFTARDQRRNSAGNCLSIADFVAGTDAEFDDYVGLYMATVGVEAQNYAESLKDADSYKALLVRSLCDCIAEALSEYARTEIFKMRRGRNCACGAASENSGICVACGYPSFPDHRQKAKFARLLGAEKIGIELTSSFMMNPAASVACVWIANKSTRYTSPTIAADQIAQEAARRADTVENVSKYMAAKPMNNGI